MSKPEQLITEHIDIWTSAILAKSTAGRGSSKKYELYGIKKLRELILELAVRGKLVPQDTNDEPASILLEKITTEKARLVRQGKIKKAKPLANISEQEKLFDLPKDWVWCRLQDIGYDLGQKKPDVDFTYIDVGSINKDLGVIKEAKVLNIDEAPSRARKLVKKGTVIYSTVRPYLLNIAIIEKDFVPEPIASTAFAIVHPLEGVSSNFIYRYLRSPSFVGYVESCQTGIAYPAINDKQFFNGLIPLPPKEEQNRIVAKVDELMLLCNQLEQQTQTSIDAHATLVESLLATLTDSADANELAQNWARISEYFDSLFTTEQSIEALKQTVLQLAVMGKLVPQNTGDEPASVLLEKIAEEKEQLIRDKKIKKEKSLLTITDDEKPFELPQGWVWCRLQSISSKITDGDHQTPPRISSGYRLLSAKNIRDGFLDMDNCDYISEADYIKSRERCCPEKGDILIVSVGGTIGRSSLVSNDDQFALVRSVAMIKPLLFNSAYLKYAMDSPFLQNSIHSNKRGGAQPCLYLSEISKFVFAMPPLEEQKRIVAKVDELMRISDQLKDKLQQSQVTQIQLTDTLIEKSLA